MPDRTPRRRRIAFAPRLRLEPLESRLVPANTLSVGDADLVEGDAGTADLVFTVTRTGDPSAAVSVGYATADGTAVAGNDYAARTGTLSIPAGAASAEVRVPVSGDRLDEPDETLTLTLAGPVLTGGAPFAFAARQTLPTGAAPVGIATADLNGDGRPDLVVANRDSDSVSVYLNTTPAGSATLAFAPRLDIPTGSEAHAVAVGDLNGDGKPDLAVADRNSERVTVLLNTTPAGGSTATFATGVNFAAQRPRSVAIGDVNADGKPDLVVSSEDFGRVAVFVNATATGATAPAFAARQDFTDGGGPVRVLLADVNGDGRPDVVTANSGASTVAVLLNGTAAGSATVALGTPQTFATAADPADVAVGDLNGDGRPDFAASSFDTGRVSVLLNTTAAGGATVTVSPRQDFAVGSAPRGVTLADLDGDGRPDVVVDNSDTSASTNPSGYTVSAFRNLTAAGAMAASLGARQDFAAGRGAIDSVAVDLNGDGVPDLAVADRFDDTFSAYVQTSFRIARGTAVGTIVDDDPAPTLTVSDVTLAEGNAGTTAFTFTVTLSAASSRTVTVSYATADGTAVAGSDYAATGGTLTFAAGRTSRTVTVTVNGDTVYENDETFTLVLSAPTNATAAAGTGTGGITNDDAAPTIAVNDVTVGENGTLTFTVTLTGATTLPVAVDYATADGAAKSTAGGPGTPDYAATGGTLTFNPSAAGTQTLTVTVPLANDATNEPTEQFTLNLSGSTNGALIARGTGTATITDDDAVPSLAVSDVTAAEGDPGTTAFTFTVTLGAASGQPITVNYATADGTATAGSDYAAASGTLAFAPGETTKTVTVVVTGDTTVEGAEAFTLNLSAPTNAALADAQGVGTVANDDAPPVAAVAGPTASAEGSAVTFTGTFADRAGAANGPFAYRWHVAASNGQAVADLTGTAPAYGTVPAFAFTPTDDGTYVVTLTVTDRDGAAGPAATATLVVANANPTATLVNDGPRAASGPVTVRFTNVADPSPADAAAGLRYSFDFNDDGDFTDPGEVADSPNPSAVFAAPSAGTFVVHGRVTDKDGGFADLFTAVGRVHLTAASAGGDVRVYNADGTGRFAVHPFTGFDGPVSVAVGDVTGDGFDDLVVGSGGVASHVKVFDGRTFAEVASFFAYQPEFAGGVTVAAADVLGTGRAQVVTGAGAGGAPHVKVFDLANGGPPVGADGRSVAARSFLAYDAAFRGGANVAAGVLDASGHAKLVTGAGPGGGPHVRVFDVAAANPAVDADGHSVDERSFFPYAAGFGGGVFVAAGDGLIVTGAGPGGGPHVRVFSYPDVVNSRSAFPFTAADSTPRRELGSSPAPAGTFTAGVRVGLGEYGGQPVVLAGSGPGVAPRVKVLRLGDLGELADLPLGDDTGSGVFAG